MCGAVSRQLVSAGFGWPSWEISAASIPVLDHVVWVFTSSLPPNPESHSEPAKRLSCE